MGRKEGFLGIVLAWLAVLGTVASWEGRNAQLEAKARDLAGVVGGGRPLRVMFFVKPLLSGKKAFYQQPIIALGEGLRAAGANISSNVPYWYAPLSGKGSQRTWLFPGPTHGVGVESVDVVVVSWIQLKDFAHSDEWWSLKRMQREQRPWLVVLDWALNANGIFSADSSSSSGASRSSRRKKGKAGDDSGGIAAVVEESDLYYRAHYGSKTPALSYSVFHKFQMRKWKNGTQSYFLHHPVRPSAFYMTERLLDTCDSAARRFASDASSPAVRNAAILWPHGRTHSHNVRFAIEALLYHDVARSSRSAFRSLHFHSAPTGVTMDLEGEDKAKARTVKYSPELARCMGTSSGRGKGTEGSAPSAKVFGTLGLEESYICQTGSRHFPPYFDFLVSYAAMDCSGGYFFHVGNASSYRITKWKTPFDMSPGTKLSATRTHAPSSRLRTEMVDIPHRIVRHPYIYQWESFKLWEALACGAAVVMPDMEFYDFKLPVMPTPWVHYVPVRFDSRSLRELEENIIDNSIDFITIGRQGYEWARQHYSPLSAAQRFLQDIQVLKQSEFVKYGQPHDL
mmetsp:Transcript_4481/g.12548  ORF Transcript_4481/g.12548 Transcript_4481/m.12548 type:complete len:567 (-) Transcript_4481:76-1776(-)|eukprot:CAMPEP_0119124242 /NCGR_PEP_ID=MMETSP1310-20130426/3926_1 /TAXON_ID=464262 /ORGANISM="Genus nov. species nov., Strain RCC2339" /LENGTH=566 /DNA_ID=CAMNT_0007114165 /DNA_START=166 /DNA_END=1866 /DNA_ORIENTATION=-